MFKKKAFLISLALLASNFLLPNEVKSGLEIGEEITSETQEVNFKIERTSGGYEGSLMLNNQLTMGKPFCSGETLGEFISSCVIQVSHFGDGGHGHQIIVLSMGDPFSNLGEEEQDIEDEVETEEDVVVLEEEVEEEEVVETTEAENIDFDSITKDDLPLKVYCPDRGADLIIREKKKKKGYVVKITRRRGERFFDGRKFRKAVKKFKKALENEC